MEDGRLSVKSRVRVKGAMVDKRDVDDRSMNEILASIRKIVTDEEATRRKAEEARRVAETGSGAEIFVLTADMRADRAPAAAREAAAPVEEDAYAATIEAAAHHMDEPAPEAPAFTDAPPFSDFSQPGLTAEEVEEIVRRVVREELQGPIGAQISRKVRRLIRDEVSKAMEDESLL